MAKQKPKPKTSWSKRMTNLPYGKRVTARLNNEITRLENTAQMIEGWPDNEHDIVGLKKNVANSLAWLRNAQAVADEIPDDFKPAVRRPQRKLQVGDTVTITKRYFADYGYDKPPTCTVLDFVGKRIRLRDEDGTEMLVLRGYIVFKEVADE